MVVVEERSYISEKFLACRRPLVKNDDQSQVGGPGFSRVVYYNDPDNPEALIPNYGDNYVRTTKYDLGTFFPKFLFEQFTRVVNIYFLIIGIMAFTPLDAYSTSSAILPLTVMIGATMLKEAAEDWTRKKQDIVVNSRKIKVYRGEDGAFGDTEWRNMRVADIVKVDKDNFFPADLLLLSSNYDEAICYVETMNLDGETNLKMKQALEITSRLEDSSFQIFKVCIKCEDPNANLYSFVGTMDIEEQPYSLSTQQLLPRDSKLRNTDYN